MTSTVFVDLLRARYAAHPTYMGSAPSLLVHSGHLADIKEAARRTLPWIAPQTRLELVARSLGYKSQAALASAMAEATAERPLALQMSSGRRSDLHQRIFDESLEDTDFPWERPKQDAFPLTLGNKMVISEFGFEEARKTRLLGLMSTGSIFLTHLHQVWRDRPFTGFRPPSPDIGEGNPVERLPRTVYLHGRHTPELVQQARSVGMQLEDHSDTVALVPLHAMLDRLMPSPVAHDTGIPRYHPPTGYHTNITTMGRTTKTYHNPGACPHHIPLEHAIFDVDENGVLSIHHPAWEREASLRFGACDPEWEGMDTLSRIQASRSQIGIWIDLGIVDKNTGQLALDAVAEIRADTSIRDALDIRPEQDILMPASAFFQQHPQEREDSSHTHHEGSSLPSALSKEPGRQGPPAHWREAALIQQLHDLGPSAWEQAPTLPCATSSWVPALAQATVLHATNKAQDKYWHNRAGHLLETLLHTERLLGPLPTVLGTGGDHEASLREHSSEATVRLSRPWELLRHVTPFLRASEPGAGSGDAHTEGMQQTAKGAGAREAPIPINGVRVFLALLQEQEEDAYRTQQGQTDADRSVRRATILAWERMLRTPEATRDSIVDTLEEHLLRVTATCSQERAA